MIDPQSEPLIDDMPRLIQAGMGIRVSSARLANITSRLGALGVVSSVALRHIVIEEVRSGDEEAIALARAFPIPQYVEELLAFAPGGPSFKKPVPLDLPDPKKSELPKRLSAIAAFVEVMRAKQGHNGKIGINVMWKCSLTVLPSIYGAMLAGVDALLCGAGVPMELPDIVRRIRAGENMEYDPLNGMSTPVRLEIAGDGTSALLSSMKPPHLMPILSNFAFPKRILDIWEREQGGVKPFAFILENHAAGGHNAPPRNKTDFGELDDIDAYFDKVKALGVPIYVAGAFENGGTREDFLHWRERGAYGIQVGSRFALCNESGMRRDIKEAIVERHAAGEDSLVTNRNASPTGFPFKLLPLEQTVANPEVYAARKRICNKGYLLQSHRETQADGAVKETYICPAMPEKQYVKLGGELSETQGRQCLCNGLLSTVGFDSDIEPPVITLGKSGGKVTKHLTAREVIADIMTPEYVAESEQKLRIV